MASLASGDVATANAYADAAVARLADSDLGDDPDAAYLVMDVERLVSDCRWAANRAEDWVSLRVRGEVALRQCRRRGGSRSRHLAESAPPGTPCGAALPPAIGTWQTGWPDPGQFAQEASARGGG